MRNEVSETINDDEGNPHSYVCIQHGAREGFTLLPRISTVVSGPLGQLAEASGGSDGDTSLLDAQISGTAVAEALSKLSEALVAEGGVQLLLDVLKYTTRDGQKVEAVFDQAYQGNYGELLSAVIFAMKANFGKSLSRLPFAQAASLQSMTQV